MQCLDVLQSSWLTCNSWTWIYYDGRVLKRHWPLKAACLTIHVAQCRRIYLVCSASPQYCTFQDVYFTCSFLAAFPPLITDCPAAYLWSQDSSNNKGEKSQSVSCRYLAFAILAKKKKKQHITSEVMMLLQHTGDVVIKRSVMLESALGPLSSLLLVFRSTP